MFGRKRGKVVDRFVDASGQACGRNIVAQDSAIHDLGKEGRLRDEFTYEVRNVFLTFWRKSLLVSCSSTEGDHHYFPALRGDRCPSERTGVQQCATQNDARGTTQELAATAGESAADIRKHSSGTTEDIDKLIAMYNGFSKIRALRSRHPLLNKQIGESRLSARQVRRDAVRGGVDKSPTVAERGLLRRCEHRPVPIDSARRRDQGCVRAPSRTRARLPHTCFVPSKDCPTANGLPQISDRARLLS